MPKPRYEPPTCECCGQTKTYALIIDRGTAEIVQATAMAIRKKKVNCVHPRNDMETKPYTDMHHDGFLSSNQVGNLSRARFHGLIARVKDMPGSYCLTSKGAKFLRGEAVQAAAIVSKVEKRNIGYLENYNTTLKEIIKDDVRWKGLDYEVVDGRLVFDNYEQNKLF